MRRRMNLLLMADSCADASFARSVSRSVASGSIPARMGLSNFFRNWLGSPSTPGLTIERGILIWTVDFVCWNRYLVLPAVKDYWQQATV